MKRHERELLASNLAGAASGARTMHLALVMALGATRDEAAEVVERVGADEIDTSPEAMVDRHRRALAAVRGCSPRKVQS